MKTPLLTLAVLTLGLAVTKAAEPDHDFVTHEWGTFTSVQGADGVQMVWNPLVAPELPSFVYDHTRMRGAPVPGSTFKIGMATLQRMETPVIYFYSDKSRTVDVSVRFPEGSVTEWYPQEAAADLRDPLVRRASGKDVPVLHWQDVCVLSPSSRSFPPLLVDGSGSHYYAARDTDSSPLIVPAGGQKSEVEKFLFYRGVAGFQAPLTVKLDQSDPKHIILTNNGAEELRQLFVYEVRAGGGVWLGVEHLQPGETRAISLDLASGASPLTAADMSLDAADEVNSPRLNTSLVDALLREGLYQREARAMVKTWEDSWFGEPGLRVLYTLPRPWTDRTLPLTISPSPKAIQRVMIARAEIITPAMEQALLKEVERYIAATPDERPKIVAETRALGLGRFTGPTLTRLFVGVQRTPEFSTLAWTLVQAVMAPPPKQVAATTPN